MAAITDGAVDSYGRTLAVQTRHEDIALPRDSRAFLPGVATGHELVGGAHAHRRDLCHHTGVASASRLLIGLYAPAARPR